MGERFDAVVLGAGPGGEVVADRLIRGGRRVALVERELIGGECGYWACIPSKTLLRPPEVRGEASRSAGVERPALDWPATAAYRDRMIRQLDDSRQVEGYEQQGATVVKGAARVAGPGAVEVDGRRLETDHIVVATGSDARVPPFDGSDAVPLWTNREATTLKEIPKRALVIGAGPVGVELGQMMSRFGSEVTLVQHADRPLNREEPRIGELLAEVLAAEGIDVRVGRSVKEARAAGGGVVVGLDNGERVTADVIVVGAGRSPRAAGLGLETVGIQLDDRGGIPVDVGCRAADGVWAVGDVTGVAPFTHVAKYQARIVADNIMGASRRADYRAVPRVVFSDPEVAAVGFTAERAREEGIEVATAEVNLPALLARPWTYEEEPRGDLGLVADRARGVLIGAWAVAPLASEWIHTASLAIRAEVPIETLLDGIAQFPTFSEGYLGALERLEL